ncbi:hypothetical protein F4778DRAFT_759046 [Xylariomycetidae sp. FL2044]|nr:hypothetical protein F4778DRAFT_759046 [Xylariomycetidae sp. FL2044]
MKASFVFLALLGSSALAFPVDAPGSGLGAGLATRATLRREEALSRSPANARREENIASRANARREEDIVSSASAQQEKNLPPNVTA